MGAWGVGLYDSDDALDFLVGLADLLGMEQQEDEIWSTWTEVAPKAKRGDAQHMPTVALQAAQMRVDGSGKNPIRKVLEFPKKLSKTAFPSKVMQYARELGQEYRYNYGGEDGEVQAALFQVWTAEFILAWGLSLPNALKEELPGAYAVLLADSGRYSSQPKRENEILASQIAVFEAADI